MAGRETQVNLRIPELRRRLREPGTRLAEVPPEWQGLTWSEFDQVWLEDMREATKAVRDKVPWINELRIATARDNYGWRSLSGGTAYFGGKENGSDDHAKEKRDK